MQTLDRPANFFERFWITLDRAAPLAYEIFPYLKLKGGVKERLLQESYFKTLDAFPFLKEGVIIKNGKVYWSYKGKSIKDSFALRKIEGGEKEFQKLYKEIINYPRFDLTRQLGLKLYLIKCSDKTDYIVFRFSHLLMDWRGGTCFLEELCQCYNSLMKGLNPVFTKAGDK
ncbi:MAG: hypothetical protein SWZ49_03525, partial [Cyanobacteriota bacterium]|nr:hypothetical protein [Cyanobacteriota bacterium]